MTGVESGWLAVLCTDRLPAILVGAVLLAVIGRGVARLSRPATAALLALAAVIYAGAGAAATQVLALAMLVIGAGRQWQVRWRHAATGAPRGGAGALLACLGPGTLCAAVASLSFWPAYLEAASVGAFAAAATAALAAAVDWASPDHRFSLPGLRLLAQTATGGVTAVAACAAVAAGSIIVVFAWQQGMLGPGDPALVMVAAIVGLVLDERLRSGVLGSAFAGGGGAGGPAESVARSAAVSLCGAVLAGLIVAFMP